MTKTSEVKKPKRILIEFTPLAMDADPEKDGVYMEYTLDGVNSREVAIAITNLFQEFNDIEMVRMLNVLDGLHSQRIIEDSGGTNATRQLAN